MNVQFKARGSRGEIWLYEQVGESFWGEGISAKAFQKELTALGKVSTINLRINSPGGDVFDGFAIYNQLKQHPARVEVDVDGVAASIASIIAMAGDEIRMAANSLLMIHNPHGMAIGDEDEMNRVAALLKTIKGNLVDTYVARTGIDKGKVADWMDDETWLTAQAAVENGFADRVTEEARVSACFDYFRNFRNVPAALKRQAGQQPVLDMRRVALQGQAQRLAALA